MSNQLAVYMNKPENLAQFNDVLGIKSAQGYIQSVILAVSASPDLMKCTPDSIMRTALRAASLGLSCDPALKQAWIVPYNKKVGDGGLVSEAQFQPHYKGLHTLAMRTGKYFTIHVSPVYDGQRVLENPLTGLHVVQQGNLLLENPAANPAYIDVTERRKKDLKVIGWLGYFKTTKGFEKSIWMSVAEIDDHARVYVKNYDKNPNWNNTEKRGVMEMKTVLRQLLSWADLSGKENEKLVEALSAEPAMTEETHGNSENIVEGAIATTSEIPSSLTLLPQGEGSRPAMTYEDAAGVVIRNADKTERFLGELNATQLQAVIEKRPEVADAARIVLEHDFQMVAA